MSCFTLNKKFSPPKKAWKRLISTLQSKLLRRKSRALSSKTNHSHHVFKQHAYSSFPRQKHHYHHHQNHCYLAGNQKEQEAQKSASTIFVDKLYANPLSLKDANDHLYRENEKRIEAAPTLQKQRISTMEIEYVDQYDLLERDRERVYSIVFVSEDNNTSKSMQLGGVDAKAEEFINRRREIWRLERQQSEEEYWEMLARGA